MRRIRLKFWLILVLAVLATVIAYPRESTVLRHLGIHSSIKLRQGLDLKGGAYLVYQADLSKVAKKDQAGAMQGLTKVLTNRVNPSGTSETTVQIASNNRVVIQIPGSVDVAQVVNLLGQKADLEFFRVPANNPNSLEPTGVSGSDVSRADASIDQTGQPIVQLKMKGGKSTQNFGNVTTSINQTGDRLVTMLDQQVIFGPATVQNPITDGNAQLSGNFTIAQAKQIAQLINSGALPVPITKVSEQTIGPTLGQESVQRSVVAGIIGLVVVALFMLSYYRLVGLVAVLALFVYTVLTITVYKLSAFTPYSIVLTLAGIAGFILSIGMAVDANILIFERMKEELRRGKSLVAAVEAGFDRAWTSIRDSNVSTLITCIILYEFSGSTPIIKGFAVTLGLGVLISMFTAVVISRTWLRLLIRTKPAQRLVPAAFHIKPEESES